MWVDPRAGRRRFSAFAAAVVEPRSNVRPATSARIASYLRVQIMPAFGEVALGKINRLSVQSWIDSMAQVLGPRTVRDAYRVFAGFMREAVRKGMPVVAAHRISPRTPAGQSESEVAPEREL